MSVWMNYTICKYISMFPVKNLEHKVLTHVFLNYDGDRNLKMAVHLVAIAGTTILVPTHLY